MSLYPTGVFVLNVKVVTSCSKLLGCLFVSLYLPFFWFTDFQNPFFIFVFSFSCNHVSLECLKSHCIFVYSGLQSFLNTSRIFAHNTQQELIQKQLIDGANDLHAWYIEDVCIHLNCKMSIKVTTSKDM